MNFKFKSLLLVVVFGFFAVIASLVAGVEEEERWIVRDGAICGEIYVADDCSTDELIAAQDLAKWIGKVCGIEDLCVRLESFTSQENPEGIFVGKTLAAQKEHLRPEAFGPEAFIITSRGNALYLTGANAMATRHAVAKLLTQSFGVEFVFPGDDGAEWTPKTQVPFPKKNRLYFRPWTWRSIGVNNDEHAAWTVNLGFGTRPSVSHNLHSIFTPELYAQYPQLAPKSFGKVNARKRGGYAPQANLANPLAETVALNAAEKYFEENPEAPMFSVGINDCTSWDESGESQAAYGDGAMRWFRNLPNRSNYFWDFANRVAHAIAKTEYADKKISAIAYLDCQDAPTFPLAKNVFPVLCADRSLWIFPEFAEEDKALMRRWSKSGVSSWGIYDYYYGNPFLFPRIFFNAQAESIRYAYNNGARFFYAEIFPQIPFDAPKIWLLSRLLENPNTDPEFELKRFCELAYGSAADSMYAFFEHCEKCWCDQGGQCRWIKAWRNENSAHLFNAFSKCFSLLENARAALPKVPESDRERRIVARLEATRLYLERAEKFAASFHARETLECCSQSLDASENLAAVLESPAWNFEKIYNDAAWTETHPESGFTPSQMRESDPRPSALVRIVEFLRRKPRTQKRVEIEKRLREILVSLPKSADPVSLKKLIPALLGAPVFQEDFEALEFKNPEDGETYLKSSFVALDQDGWRQGKTLSAPASLHLKTAPAENLFCGEEVESHAGCAALKISGACESTELFHRIPVRPGLRLAASVQARGKISVGATAGLVLAWTDARGRPIGERKFVRLSCGETAEWSRFVVAGEAPENAAYAEVHLGAGLFAPDDYVCFDTLEVFEL